MQHLKTPNHLSNWLRQEHSLLKAYQKKAHYLLELNELWDDYSDKALASNSYIANFHEAKLVIAVENASWGTRLHYAIPDLLTTLQTWKLLESLQKITWYIRPQDSYVEPKSLTRPLPVVSQEAQQLLSSVANTVVNDELKVALKRLANAIR